MSLLPDDARAALTELLISLSSADNIVRSQAELALNTQWIDNAQSPENLQILLIGLAELAVAGNSDLERSFSAILFRRISLKHQGVEATRVIQKVPANVLVQLKATLLQGFVAQQSRDVRHKISDAIGELARIGGEGSWPELLQTLLQSTHSEDDTIRESCFRVFSTAPALVGVQHIDMVIPVFQSGLQDSSELVRIAAVGAFSTFFRVLPKSTWPKLQDLLPLLLNVISPLQHDSDKLNTVLEHVIELAGLAPKMFRPAFSQLLDFCVNVTSDKENMDDNVRISALELAVTFADEAPKMCKKDPTYASKVVRQCLIMLTEVGVDDDENATEWQAEDDLKTAGDNEEVALAACQALDRISLRLGGKSILPPLFEYLPDMLNSSNWLEKQAALMALSNVAEGCHDDMITGLSRVLDMIVPCLNDPHPRVQWATCNALGQLSTDFAPVLQRDYSQKVLPYLVGKLNDLSLVPRVQAHAAAAIVNFSESATKDVLDPYLDSLLSALASFIRSPVKYVQEQALTTIAIVADVAKDHFAKYYDQLMALLFQIIGADAPKEYRILKGRAIECAALVALAVGKERFMPQFQQLMHLMVKTQQEGENDPNDDLDDPCLAYLTYAYGRICRIVGTDFIPYLGTVMPSLLIQAKTKADYQLFDDEENAENYVQNGWDVIPIEGRFIGIHTPAMETKSNAIKFLSVYASHLGENFYPYAKEVVFDIIKPSLEFYFHTNVRSSATLGIPHIITSAQAASKSVSGPVVMELWVPLLNTLIECLDKEPYVEVVSQFYRTISDSISLIGSDAISSKQMDDLASAMVKSISAYLERVSQRLDRQDLENDEYIEEIDEDEEDEEELDDELIGEINSTIDMLFKTCGTAFVPAYSNYLAPIVATCLEGNAGCRQFSLLVIDSIIEHCGPQSYSLTDNLREKLVQNLTYNDPVVRQAAAYGVGVAAQKGSEQYAPMVTQSLQTLFQIASLPEAQEEENADCTDNAVSAIAKILRRYGSQMGSDQLTQAWTAWIKTFPVVHDAEAAAFSYRVLSELIQENNAAVTGNIKDVFDAVVKALLYAVLPPQVQAIVVASTKTLLSTLPDPMSLFNQLSTEEQQVVQEAFR